MKKVISEFKEFMMRGNVIDLSVGVVIGSAFTAIVNGIVTGCITPIINLIFSVLTGAESKEEAFSSLQWSPVPGTTFDFGLVITALITFLITGLVLFSLVKAVNTAQGKLDAITKKNEEEEAKMNPPKCPFCLEEVAEGATRCPHCTAELPEPAKATPAE